MRFTGLILSSLVLACSSSSTFSETPDGGEDSSTADAYVPYREGGASDARLDPDAACGKSTATVTTKQLPVDIVWIVDNSASMAPAVAELSKGINAFASTVGGKGLDYQVIMLSDRGTTSPTTINGKVRYPVCVPAPLSGDNQCGDGLHFKGVDVDIYSTQPLEQLLGTLGQTTGYLQGDARGSKPWKSLLRPDATKTLVVVSDDNSRLVPNDFENFAGGVNPNNPGFNLPPGILDKSWNGLFDGYVFSGIYGWGSANDPTVRCTYPDKSLPPASGATYTTLVQKTKGSRAKICDGAPGWTGFWNDIETAVVTSSKISCALDIPVSQNQSIDPTQINVILDDGSTTTWLNKVADANACAGAPGWYYDNDQTPTKVILCPSSCTTAQTLVGPSKSGKVEILFGCATVVR